MAFIKVDMKIASPAAAGLSVQCDECGRMLAYKDSMIDFNRAFKFYHQTCAAALEGK
jgi:hypothetical protein